MKLNNKGYLIVEIVLASVITFGVAYFLFDLTVNLKNKSDNVQAKTIIMTDRAIIENYIMKQLSTADNFNCGYDESTGNELSKSGSILIKTNNSTSFITIESALSDKSPYYFVHKNNSEVYYTKSVNNYIKDFNNSSLSCVNTSDSINITIVMKDKISDEDYSIRLEKIK